MNELLRCHFEHLKIIILNHSIKFHRSLKVQPGLFLSGLLFFWQLSTSNSLYKTRSFQKLNVIYYVEVILNTALVGCNFVQIFSTNTFYKKFYGFICSIQMYFSSESNKKIILY